MIDKCYRCDEVISMCPCDESTYTADDEISRLRAELDACKRDVEIVRFLRCGGWEVLQNPKYWTLENKFYGAIAEAMAEVAAEGDKNGDA
mgnify:CR=1 FL=1